MNGKIKKKYIYLDWNAFRKILEHNDKQETCGIELEELIYNVKKKYIIPYSEAHILDRCNNFKEIYRESVERDLQKVNMITDSSCLRLQDNGNFYLQQIDAGFFFNEIVDKLDKKNGNYNWPIFKGSFEVDMNKIPKAHPFYDILRKYEGRMSDQLMQDFLNDSYEHIFLNTKRYQSFRNFVDQIKMTKKVKEHAKQGVDLEFFNNLVLHIEPFLKSFGMGEIELKEKWKGIAIAFFSIYSEKIFTEKEYLIKGYNLLDLHPKFHDKLKKDKNTLTNIANDAKHAYWGTESEYFISDDSHMLKKVKFLYEVYGFHAKTMNVSDFFYRFV